MVNILNPTRTNANPLGVIGALFNQPQQSHVSGSQTMPITQPPKVPLPPSPAPTPEELAQPKASDAVIGRPKNLITVDGKDFVVPLTMTQNPRQQAEAQMQQAATEQQQQQSQFLTGSETSPQIQPQTFPSIQGILPNPQNPNAVNIPLVSELAQASDIAAQAAIQTDLFRKIRNGTATAQEIRQATNQFQLTPLDLEVIKAGEADVSKTGAFVESLPVVPREIKRYINIFASPSKKVDELTANLAKSKDNIILWSDLAKSNPAASSAYIKLIKDEEANILRMESRIKVITIQSPDLRANPEIVNAIQYDINGILATIDGKRKELYPLGLNI